MQRIPPYPAWTLVEVNLKTHGFGVCPAVWFSWYFVWWTKSVFFFKWESTAFGWSGYLVVPDSPALHHQDGTTANEGSEGGRPQFGMGNAANWAIWMEIPQHSTCFILGFSWSTRSGCDHFNRTVTNWITKEVCPPIAVYFLKKHVGKQQFGVFPENDGGLFENSVLAKMIKWLKCMFSMI